VEADGDAVPENEGAPVLFFVGAEALFEVLVGLEAAAQLHGRPHGPRQGLAPAGAEITPGTRDHSEYLQAGMGLERLKERPQLGGLLWSS
jgi:hypothetical protein